MVKNFKKIMACLLAFAVIFTCIGSALATVSAETAIATNANGKATDVGIWYTPYNCNEFFAHRFADPEANPVGYKGLLPDGSYGIPFAGNIDIIDFYIKEMADAGIDFVMFDLTNGGLTEEIASGWGANEFAGNRWNVQYSKLFAERLSVWNDTHAWKIRYAVSVGTYADICEGYDDAGYVANVQAEGVKEIFLNDEVIGDDYYIFDGKPLITLFDWTTMATNTTAVMEYVHDETSTLSEFTVRSASVGQAGGYSWNNNDNDGAAVYDDEVVTVCPGHALASATTPTVSRRNGLTYQENWDVVLDAETAPRVVMISSFNDYMENTAVFVTNTDGCVEANAEEKWESPYQYWDMTVDYIAALREKCGDSSTVETGNENYALTATVTQDHWCNTVAGPLTNINDGSLDNRTLAYANQGLNDHERIYFEFDSAKTINNVNLYADCIEAANYGFKDVAIEVLVDGKWVRVAELHDLTVTNKQLVPVYFAPVKTTKVAVVVNAKNQENKTYASFAEIKIFNNSSVTEDDYTGIQEGIAIDGIRSENYALNCDVTTSAFSRTLATAYPVANVTNGSYSSSMYTYFSDAGNANYSPNHYIEIDFAATRAINEVVFVSCNVEGKFLNDYAVEVKLADGTWKRVAARHYSVEGQIVTSKAQKVSFYFEEVEAIAIRVYVNVTNHSDILSNPSAAKETRLFSCTEIEAYYNSAVTASKYTGIVKPTDGAVIPGVKSDNYALTATVTQDHWCNTNAGPLTNINDGSLDNRTLGFANQGSNDHERYYFEFASAKTINNVDLYADCVEANKYGFKDVAIEVLVDGKWVRVAELHDLTVTNKQLVPVYFAPVKTTKVAVVVNAKNQVNKTYASFAEVEIYSDSAVTEADYTGRQEGIAIDGTLSANYAASANGSTISTNLSNTSNQYNSGNNLAVIIDGKYNDRGFGYPSIGGAAWGVDQSADRYFQVDFGATREINQVKLTLDVLELKYCHDYAVDVLTTAGEWKRTAEIHIGTDVITAKGHKLTLNFAEEVCTAIRVSTTANGHNDVINGTSTPFRIVISLTEIEAYHNSAITAADYSGITGGGVITVTNTSGNEVTYDSTIKEYSSSSSGNFALGQKVTTSNTNWSLFAAQYPASNLTDGVHSASETAACAISNYINGMASFTVNYDKAYTINKVVLLLSAHERNLRPDEYVIDVLTADGWVRVGIQPDNDAVTMTFYFEAIECTAVRVVANAKLNAENSTNFRINEIETYFDETVTEDMYTGTTSALEAQYTANIQGDVDGNSWVNAVDLAYALNWYTRARERVEGNAAIMDTNRDGKYDIRDYIYLVEVIATRDYTLMD